GSGVSDDGVVGASRFLNRVWAFASSLSSGQPATGNRQLVRKTHQTIDAVTRRMERFDFNTAISALMELSNAIGDAIAAGVDTATLRQSYMALLQMLHPFAPHITEELWEML